MMAVNVQKTNSKMSSPLFYELKKKASSFLKEKIRTARLALTDVTPAELMTEEATNENSWPPDTRTIGVISRAAFDVDDYWRIVEILHRRLSNFDRKNWRGSYKALILLEYLLSHGPLRLAEEFEVDIDVIKQMGRFQHIDEKGFNWGMSVRKLSDRVLKLLGDTVFLKEERARARNLTRGIQGFGSFSQQHSLTDSSFKELSRKTYERCNSHYTDHQSQEDKSFDLKENFLVKKQPQIGDQDIISSKPEMNLNIGDHPFCQNEHQREESLLSSED
ncbi:epsin-3 [Rosa chinensis]|uniref:epsin-3 n=1 Tax=Rosa chinensis TaxID=74649 RepID=UPI001AD8AAEA|nr:epsin-3 [Rosa chinensis]